MPLLTVENMLFFGIVRLRRAKNFWQRLSAEGGTAEFVVEDFAQDLAY